MEIKIPQAVKIGRVAGIKLETRVPQAVQMFRSEPAYPSQAPPEPPGFRGSDIEWLVYWWLERRYGPEGQLWFFQAPYLGGRQFLGGQVVDFVVADRKPELAIGVQGEYWHYGTTAKRGLALEEKRRLQGLGITVIYVRGMDLKRALNATMEAALQEQQLFAD